MTEWRVLGEAREVRLGQGVVRYREVGEGEPVVFVHGLLVNGGLWRDVVPLLSGRFRCIVPDWPLGGHVVPMDAEADLSVVGQAGLISDFLDALDLEGVTLVGNDTGGALCQLVATSYPGRIGRLVLTNCDAFDNFLPLLFRYLQWGSHLHGFLWLISKLLRVRALHRLPITFGLLTKRPIDKQAVDSYLTPVMTNAAIRRDLGKTLRSISPRHTLAAAEKFSGFNRPVLIAWAPEDKLFTRQYAERLRDSFQNARLEEVRDSYTFIPEDQPERLAGLIETFLLSRAGTVR